MLHINSRYTINLKFNFINKVPASLALLSTSLPAWHFPLISIIHAMPGVLIFIKCPQAYPFSQLHCLRGTSPLYVRYLLYNFFEPAPMR
jgi:hypothetical protein